MTKMTSSRCDALIVGGRCAGAATAMLLAQHGLSVRVVEKRPYGADTLSTHALMRGAVMQLHRWDLLGRLQAAGTPPVRSATFTYGDERVTVGVKPADGVDALFAPRRTVLDTLLVDAAREAGARIDFGAAFVGPIRDDHGRVRGALVRTPDGSHETMRADVVIGADGIGSSVAQTVHAATLHQGRHASGLFYAYWSGLNASGYEWSYHDGISTGLIPTNGGEACVFVAVPAADFAAFRGGVLRRHYCDLIERRAPALYERLRDATMASKVRVFGGRTGHLRKAFGGGWALVGDAGYFKDPLTAHGITDALRDAEGLAHAVARGTNAALAYYQAERDAASLSLLEATDEIASFRWSMDRLKTLHRTVNAAMKDEVEMLRRRHREVEKPHQSRALARANAEQSETSYG